MMNKLEKEDIKNIFGQFQTPEYNPTDDIIKKINRGYKIKPKLSKFKRTLIIAAVMGIVLILSAAAAVVYNEMVFYDMSGNIRDNIEPFSPRYDYGSEEFEFEQQLRNGLNEYEMLFIHAPEYPSFYYATKKIYDYDELINYMQNKGGGQLSLPGYLPKGFEFEYADVHVTLSGNVNYTEYEPIYYEEKYGNIYEIYRLPEDETYVEHVILSYRSPKNHGYIVCNARFTWGDGIDSMSFGTNLEVNTEPELLDIPQFERSLIMSYKTRSNSNPQWTFRAVKLIDTPVKIFNISFISDTWHKNNAKNNVSYAGNNYTFNAVMYDISSSEISRGEIIKMAESIK